MIKYLVNIERFNEYFIIITKDSEHLKEFIKEEIQQYRNECNLNHIGVSNFKTMAAMFEKFSVTKSYWYI